MVIRTIKEFANSRSEEIQKLRDVCEVIREHIMSIYYWRDSDCVNHWEGELVGFIPVMRKLKGNNKYLSEAIIYENLFADYAITFYSDIYAYVDKLEQKEPNLHNIVDIDEYNIYSFLNDFYTEICHLLATNGSIRKFILYSIINKLLVKYPYDINGGLE